jgi:hypothetical protein
MNGFAVRIIHTLTDMAQAMMIDSQAPIQFLGEAGNTPVYLDQSSQNEDLKRYDHNSYQAPYERPYQMIHGFGKLTHNADGNEISYEASLQNLPRFACYASSLIPKVQHCQGLLAQGQNPA